MTPANQMIEESEFYQDLIAHYGSQISDGAARYATEMHLKLLEEARREWDKNMKENGHPDCFYQFKAKSKPGGCMF